METSREILQYLHYHPLSSREEIRVGINFQESDATLKRLIASSVEAGDIQVQGKARATRYTQTALKLTYKLIGGMSLYPPLGPSWFETKSGLGSQRKLSVSSSLSSSSAHSIASSI